MRTEVPGRMKVLNRTLSIVSATDANVSAPAPSKAVEEILCWPSGPRVKSMTDTIRP